ncbi:putative nuclease HARBI1 [Ornithodoros turicata]|uniref:putative nuclease HARBI1 n=1 Tax=Ornithodoros turicata TaxID=34597 RepID=UPI0031386ABD
MADVVSVIAAALVARSFRRERVFRSPEDAFAYDEQQFRDLFRLPKDAVRALCDELRDILSPRTARRTALSVEAKVLTALRFYATGSYQRCVGQEVTISIAQSCVSDCISSVSKAICDLLLTRYCSFPRTAEELTHLKMAFTSVSGMPACIGAIDCTHVAIIGTSEPTYRECVCVNRKGYHSLNVQMACIFSPNFIVVLD